jgi:hypothetical protein
MKIKTLKKPLRLSFKGKVYSFYFSLRYRLRESKWAIYNYFRSSQHWLIKQIPRNYQDKPELITLLLFAILVDYVETEKGLNNIDYDWEEELALGWVCQQYVEEVQSRNKSLMDTYNYIKFERPIMEKQLEKIINDDEIEDQYFSYEQLCNEKDAQALQIIVKNAPFLWT